MVTKRNETKAKPSPSNKSNSPKPTSPKKLPSTELLTRIKRAKDSLNSVAGNPLVALKAEGINSPLVITGGDELRAKRLTQWIAESFFAAPNCSVEKQSCAELSSNPRLDSFSSSLSSASLFASFRLIVLSHPDSLRANPAKRLGEILERTGDSNLIVIIAAGSDKKLLLLDHLPQGALTVEMSDFTSTELRNWIEKELLKQGHQGGITPEGTKLIADSIGNNLALISQELGRIALMIDPSTKIDRVLIEKNLLGGPEHTSFELIQALGTRNLPLAQELLQNLLEHGQHPLQISSFLSRCFRSMLFKISSQNSRADFVKSPELTNPWFMRNLTGALSRYSERRLRSIIETLGALDFQLKSSGLPPELALSLALPKLRAQRRQA